MILSCSFRGHGFFKNGLKMLTKVENLKKSILGKEFIGHFKGISQYAEWDLNKTSKTFTETLTALVLLA